MSKDDEHNQTEEATAQKLLESLQRRGAKQGSWGESKARTQEGHPVVDKQKKAMEEMKKVFEVQIEQDKKQIEELQEMIHRLQHGGGQYRG